MPASVIERAVRQPQAAIKRLLDVMNDAQPQGRPSESLRQLYDLPALRFAFNSFEVTFSAPTAGPQEQLAIEGPNPYNEVATQLAAAFNWLDSEPASSSLQIGLLEVLKDLAPPAQGQVERCEIRGALMSRAGGMRELTRDDRTFITAAIKDHREASRHLVQTEGRIGELDKDRLTFILRDRVDGGGDLACSFDEPLLDEVFDAFTSDRRVVLFGRLRPSARIVEVAAIAPTGAPLLDAPQGAFIRLEDPGSEEA